MTRLIFTILVIGVAWGVSGLGYFTLEPLLNAEVWYNEAPIFFTVYYGLWAGAVFAVFQRSIYRWTKLDTPFEYSVYVAVMVVSFGSFALLVLPNLPPVEWTFDTTPVEFFWANSWYFLPKSAEILFQQILIAALILALHELKLTLPHIALVVAILFGGFHLSMALTYDNPVYVVRYTIAATVFGAFAPYLILRVRLGFLISYAIHWSFYAVDIVLIHIIFSAI